MAEARLAARRAAGAMASVWRRLGPEQRVVAVGAVLLVVSTFGPFSFVEAAIVLTGLAVLALLRQRALGKRFHLPFGDGAVIMAAGGWAALLILVRLFDRPLGQNLLALACAAILVVAGLRQHSRRPADDVPFAAEEKPDRTPPERLPLPDDREPRTERLPPAGGEM